MKHIIVIPASFPYDVGEQFLETEINYLATNRHMRITLLPAQKTTEQRRSIPPSITLDTSLAQLTSSTLQTRLYYLIKAMTMFPFYKELWTQTPWSIEKLKYFGLAISRYQMFYEHLDHLFHNQKYLNNTIVYTYWHNEITYALQSLKTKYCFTLISRVHGGDLYQERRVADYMPLKQQFTEALDRLFVITPSATTYLMQTYRFDSKQIQLSRLGVDDHSIISSISSDHHLNIVSCSFLVSIKQIDKIIEALAVVSRTLPHIKFTWTHIGDGALYHQLYALSIEKLSHRHNVHFTFLGRLSNHEVYEFYRTNAVDLFINTSISEGVPVSIMEAMSCHIPIIAPNVGGIQDMIIDQQSGILLNNHCSIKEIANALSHIDFFKKKETRECSYQLYKKRFYAKENYENFMEILINL